jgi:hypothetical protein
MWTHLWTHLRLAVPLEIVEEGDHKACDATAKDPHYTRTRSPWPLLYNGYLARIIHEEWRIDEFFVETQTRCDKIRICLRGVTDFKGS